MKIGISMRIVTAQDYFETRDAISHDWIDLANRLNASIVLIPNKLEEISELISNLDLMVLSGGEDISDRFTGIADFPTSAINEKEFRDIQEIKIIDICIEKKIPILGVCRGMQVINLYFGGKLRKIDEAKHVAVNHKIDYVKSAAIDTSDLPKTVNSFHKLGISPVDLGQDLFPFAHSGDGLIEALKHKDIGVWGVMWHPERYFEGTFSGEDLFHKIVVQSRRT